MPLYFPRHYTHTMTSHKTPRALCLFPAFLGLALPASAQFVTGFDAGQGYSTGTIIGVDDPVLSGTGAWYVPASLTNGASIQNYGSPQSQALRLTDNNSNNFAAALDLATAIDFTKSFNLTFSIAVESMNAGTSTGATPFVNVRLGRDTNNNSHKSWLRFSINVDGTMALYTDATGGTTTTQFGVGTLSDYVNAGGYLTVSITVDPVSHTYTRLELSGSKQTQVVSSAAGLALPWISNTAGEPPSVFWINTAGSPTSVTYLDNVSLTNIPEPSAFASVLGLGALVCAATRRRRRAR